MSNLLVVDWDFFFPNPVLSAHPCKHVTLYDWTTREAPLYQTPIIWGPRAATFLRNNLPLPMTTGWEDFWDRFTYAHDISLLYGDSNLHAGLLYPSYFGEDEPAWDTVTLYDAHHDCGYNATGSFAQWRARGTLTCEDWMLAHHERGSILEVVYPPWRHHVDTVEPEPLVPVTRRVDDGTPPDRTYHAIYLCRSGAWVPPWCDDQFTAFLNRAPDAFPTEIPGEEWTHPRPDVLDHARRENQLLDQLNARIEEAPQPRQTSRATPTT